MNKEIIFKNLIEVASITTSHNAGTKKVLLKGHQTNSHITQVAMGTLRPGETVEKHEHEDMEESFYFLEGEGIYKIAGKDYPLQSGTYIHIPAKTAHELFAMGSKPLQFLYWGIEA